MVLSVIIPVYNGEKYLRTCIDSVLRCEAAAEIIVANDGSADGTETLCQSYGDKIHYLKQAHAGVGSARNRGLAAAGGDYVLFLDADDVLISETLTVSLLQQMEQQNADVYAFGFYESDEKLRIRRRELYEPRALSGSGRVMPLGGYHSAFIVRRALLTVHQLQYPDCRLCEDSIFKYSFLYFSTDTRVMAEPLFIYRRHPASASNSTNDAFTVYNGAVNAWYALMQHPAFKENNKAHRRYCIRRMVSTLYDMIILMLAFTSEAECLSAVARLDCNSRLQQRLCNVKTENRRVQLVQQALQQKKGIRRLACTEIVKKRIKHLL